ncbi:delta(3,5)-Delta(2,4)-dienoyl-CoA isomerase, mitochondrial-like [Clytia hemisphaerica]|uniref:Delta(3,5)-Delta(2,4)-dienoyl-CoA isomerase, mitochondrial n=1 Tax=Clytia hemisphaerica TaxID=252671 RepID=A0A7M5XN67_9CNID
MFKNSLRRLITQQPRKVIGLSVRSMSGDYQFETLNVVKPAENVLHVEMNRPNKRNAMNQQFFKDMTKCFTQIADDPHARVVVLSGSGKLFTAGLDVMSFASSLMPTPDGDVGRKAFSMRKMIKEIQDSLTVIEKCPQPVIAAVHSACVGGGVDMICACDIRMSTDDAWFQIKEVDLALAADIGTLQRMPKLMGSHSLIRELAYTARPMYADEAQRNGFVGRVFKDKEEMMKSAFRLAKQIASKSPIAVQTTKLQLNYARDHGVDEGLDYIASWNMGLLQTQDMLKAAQATMQNETASFDDMLPPSKL